MRAVLTVALVLGVGSGPAGADVIHLTSGSAIEVDAWRDVGDAIEFTRSGGIIRIDKRDILRIDGQSVRQDLRMYSAPAGLSGSALRAASTREAALRQMTELLGQGNDLFGQSVLSARSKADAFRRLGAKWREIEAPEALREPLARGQEALQIAVEAYTAEDEGTAPNAKERVEAARKTLQEAQGLLKKAGAEG
jgi:hypothetical protein